MNQNKKNFLFSAIGIAFVVVALVFIASPKKNKNTASLVGISSNTLSAEETSYDFGSIRMADGNVNHVFKVKNTGASPIKIAQMYTSCMCTTASIIKSGEKIGPVGMPGHGFLPKLNTLINPGEEFSVETVFDPNAHGPAGVGKIERAVYLESEGYAPLELKFSAMVTP